MHIALLVLIDPAPFDDLDPATEELSQLVSLLTSRPHLPVAVQASAHLLNYVDETRPELVEALRGLDLEWVRTGWGEPDLGAIPPALVRLAFEDETSTLQRLGLAPGTALVRHRWSDALPEVLTDLGVPGVLIPRSLTDRTGSGVVVSFDRVLPAATITAPSPELPLGDDIVVWAILTSEVEVVANQVLHASGHTLTRPTEFLASHGPRGRLRVSSTPFDPAKPDVELLWRKSVRLATRLGDRPEPRAVRLILDSAHSRYLTAAATGRELEAASASLIEARAIIDGERRRGEDWGRVSHIDWDADGFEEVQVELPEMSLVIDPRDGGRLLVLDDKKECWPIGFVPGVEPGSLCRLETNRPSFDLEKVEEGKGDVTVELSASGLGCRLVASGRRLELAFHADQGGRFGPELLLALRDARVRVDGGEWQGLNDTISLSGHRFRIDGAEHQVLMVAMMPTDVRFVPVPGGVLVWPSWLPADGGKYGLTVEFSA